MKKIFTKLIISGFASLSVASVQAQIQVEANGVGGRDIAYLSKVNGKMYYFGVSEINGTDYNLFVHDGTSSTVLKTLCSVFSSPNPNQVFEANGKGYFYFNNSGSATGNEPYITDGTPSGTILLKDINPGGGNSGSGGWFVTSNNKVYFSANDGTSGNELFVTDGTAAGTQLTKDLYPGTSSSNPDNVVAFNNEVWFRAQTGSGSSSYFKLFHSDGTSAGTTQFVYPSDLNTGASINDLFVHGGYLYFTGLDGNNNNALWRTDGTTSGTTKIFVGSGNVGTFSIFNSLGNSLFGISSNPLSWPYVYSLYSIDAVTLDTTLLKTGINLVNGQAGNGWFVNNKLVFLGKTTTAGDEPWVTDGTPSGTMMLADINSGSANSNIYRSAGVVNNELYLNTQVSDIWKTDGTAGGTQAVGGPVDIDNNYFNSFIDYNNDIYFIKTSSGKRKLFKLGLNGATGVEESRLENAMSVTPNPSAGIYHFKCNNYIKEYKIYSISGDIIKDGKINSSTLTIDLSDKTKGVYFYQIIDHNGNLKSGKIILQ